MKDEPKYIQIMGERAGKTFRMFATFRKNFPIIRHYRGLSAVDLALKLNCNPKKISDYETGRTPPKMSDLMDIAQALQVSVSDLMDKKIILEFEEKTRITEL